ncbi:MAG: fumarylacetoacetase [Planctomycetota bacterium]
MNDLNATHNPKLTSWVESANGHADFPIQNLPFGVFRQGDGPATIGVAIGDQILDLKSAAALGVFTDAAAKAVSLSTLNQVMALSKTERQTLRESISQCLSAESSVSRDQLDRCLVHQSDVEMQMPCRISDYTDFYASVYHATNVGSMFRPNNPLLPNYKHIPIGYHGRASSVVASGHPVKRPVGQLSPTEEGGLPSRGPCKLLDYEMEVGCFVAEGNQLGTSIPMVDAETKMFGLTLLNDWSARDIQKWEYQPLGPFLAKSFATTISPWVVTMEALAPFRCAEFLRPETDPQPLDYLVSENNSKLGGIDLQLQVFLQSAQMKEQGIEPMRLSQSSFTDLYWTPAQMITHHSSNGCNLQPGDLLGSGTVSGKTRDARGSMMELTWDGDMETPLPGSQRTPLQMPTGEERKFLADGDTVIMKGYCAREGQVGIGFGECVGQIIAADG